MNINIPDTDLNKQMNEFQDLLFALIDDAERCRQMTGVWPTPFTCRIYLRTEFALFEGSSHGMKQVGISKQRAARLFQMLTA